MNSVRALINCLTGPQRRFRARELLYQPITLRVHRSRDQTFSTRCSVTRREFSVILVFGEFPFMSLPFTVMFSRWWLGTPTLMWNLYVELLMKWQQIFLLCPTKKDNVYWRRLVRLTPYLKSSLKKVTFCLRTRWLNTNVFHTICVYNVFTLCSIFVLLKFFFFFLTFRQIFV